MIRDVQAYYRQSERERTQFLRALTFKKSAALFQEILRFGTRFLKSSQNKNRPVSLARLLRPRTP